MREVSSSSILFLFIWTTKSLWMIYNLPWLNDFSWDRIISLIFFRLRFLLVSIFLAFSIFTSKEANSFFLFISELCSSTSLSFDKCAFTDLTLFLSTSFLILLLFSIFLFRFSSWSWTAWSSSFCISYFI